MQFWFFFIFLFSTSCGKFKASDHKKGIGGRQFNSTDAVFNEYIINFEKHAIRLGLGSGFKVGDIPINFGDAKGHSAICISYQNGQHEVLIDRSAWKIVKNREIIVFHELGHCKLELDHDDHKLKLANGSFKTSVMNSQLLSWRLYLFNDYNEGFLQDLFLKDRSLIVKEMTALPPNTLEFFLKSAHQKP